ncbi:DUF2254 domain-containing protein [Pyxidicoccus parkwayensis]|uniref:DUF2254 domain-containing protein n=1 Tax=Pyxidicoccus parkwayensis TaxID=2813578 RepID=A0ABX7P8C1_9BACT|nr:DUF2254 family protein [Pyxidicoccus parkwaysis]QSQ26683.1 DUF2254 domain-containing protein [Pyxidicoccus parkwaysis]
MSTRRLRQLLRRPYWMVLIGLLVAGVVAGALLARQQTDTAPNLFGMAWRGTTNDARSILATLFGVQTTILTVVLSLNAPLIQSAANQYSPRLVPIYLQSAPLRRAIPLFALSSGYILSAVRELGVLDDASMRPRPVVSGAFILVLVALFFLVLCMIRTFRYMRVEHVLGLVQDSIAAATERLGRSCLAGLPLDSATTLPVPARAMVLRAPSSGYLAAVDLRRLAWCARRWGVRVRVDLPVGDHMDRGESVGWVAADDGGRVDARVLRGLAAALEISPAREPGSDPVFGLRILVDVANRALSSSSNDAYTARQALQQMRSVLRRLAALPSGDWNVVDADGRGRVSVMALRLRDLLLLAVDGPLLHGMGNPDVLEEVLRIALTVHQAARTGEDRDAAQALLERVLADASAHGGLGRERYQRLLIDAERVRVSFGGGDVLPYDGPVGHA